MQDDHRHSVRDEVTLGRAGAERRWLNLTSDQQVFVAPVLSLAAFILLAAGNQSVITHVLALIVQLVLFQIVVIAHVSDRRRRRLLTALAPLALVGLIVIISGASLLFEDGIGRGAATAISALLAIGVIVRLFGRVARAPVITLKVVGDAIAVYLMIGLTFAYLFLTLDAFESRSFFVEGPQPVSTFLYFAYVTLATVGYGDFTAAYTMGRFAAIACGLIGQLYLVTVLALIVSNLGRQRSPEQIQRLRGGASADGPGEGDADDASPPPGSSVR